MSRAKLSLLVWLLVAALAVDTSGASGCHAPSTWDGKKCTCPVGMVNCNGKCICDYGFWPVGAGCSKCDAQNNYAGKSCAGSATNIPDGYGWNGKFIIQNWTVNNCGAQLYWNGLWCNPIVYPVSCKPGYTWTGDVCVRIDAVGSPAGQYWNGKAFVAFVYPPVCEKNYNWESLTQGCVYKDAKVACPSNKYYFNGTFCTGLSSNIKCSYGYYFNGNTCVTYGSDRVPSCTNSTTWNGRTCTQGGNKNCSDQFLPDLSINACIVRGCKRTERFDPATKKCIALNAPIVITAPASNGQNVTITAGASALTPVVVSTAPPSVTPPTPVTTPSTVATPAATTTPTATSTAPSTAPSTPPSTTSPTPTLTTTNASITNTATTSNATSTTNDTQSSGSSGASTSITIGTTTVSGSAIISQGGSAVNNGNGGVVVAPGSNTYGVVGGVSGNGSPDFSTDPTGAINNALASSNTTISGIIGSTQTPSVPNVQNGQVQLPGAFGTTVIQNPSTLMAGSKINPGAAASGKVPLGQAKKGTPGPFNGTVFPGMNPKGKNQKNPTANCTTNC